MISSTISLLYSATANSWAGGDGLESAGEQRGDIVVAVALNVTGELAQKRNQLTALFVFVGGGMDAARRLSRKGSGESRKCRLHFYEIDRRGGIVFVCGHPGDDGACGFLDLGVTFVRERQTNS